MSRVTNKKDIASIASEWDAICEARSEQIDANKDFSLTNVNIPCILTHLHNCNKSEVLDVGCGTGFLTQKIADISDKVTALDISEKSIYIAKKKCIHNNINYIVGNIENFKTEKLFTTCIANMALMVFTDLKECLFSIYNLLEPLGTFLFTITHPCFWPTYWEYNNEEWFDYKKELFIENEFETTFSKTNCISTHIHRPLEMYISTLIAIGFNIIAFEEPQPKSPMPEGYNYSYPRFLFIKCQKKLNSPIQ